MDRRTACLQQADAFREKAIADPEHHDQWIDEAIKWLERAMEAGRRAAITIEPIEPGDIWPVPEPARTAATDPLASQPRPITRQ
ncbi:MAG TPA: hypothetical protein VF901_10820 [Bradyrhizobium sp.]